MSKHINYVTYVKEPPYTMRQVTDPQKRVNIDTYVGNEAKINLGKHPYDWENDPQMPPYIKIEQDHKSEHTRQRERETGEVKYRVSFHMCTSNVGDAVISIIDVTPDALEALRDGIDALLALKDVQ